MEDEMLFSVRSGDKEYLFVLHEYDTVGCLKDKIETEFGIPRSRLIVTGWKLPPDGDNYILNLCADVGTVNYLQIQERNWENSPEKQASQIDSEIAACVDFIKEVFTNLSDNVLTFHLDLLKNKIAEVCLGPLEQRKVLILYLHNKDDEFSTIFWRNLKRSEVIDIMSKDCCNIGWDLGEKKYHSALIEALNYNQLNPIIPYVERNIGVAVCLITTNGVASIFSCMKKDTSDDGFLKCLEQAVKCQIVDKNRLEQAVKCQIVDKNPIEPQYEKIVINSRILQQNFADLLGDRDYDSYEYDEHEHLKKNIAYAICGPPSNVTGYSRKIMAEVERLYKKILEKNNEVVQFKDKIEMAIVYNCTEPLQEVKERKRQKDPNYNPDEDVTPYPVFILRKCHQSEHPCRILIDHIGRVYNTWMEYLVDNKLPACRMIFPRGGRYIVDTNEKVILEWYYSPACGLGTKILNRLDIAGAVGGLTSGGVGVATTILSGTAAVASAPLVAAALPVVGITALITGAICGGYSLVRSGMTIHDRRVREEPMGFFDSSEARAAYLNIVAGGLGFFGAGTNIVVSQLVSKGVQVGTSARVAVNAINVINLGAGGVSVANSISDVYLQYQNTNEAPSALTVLQLTSNILFFGHAVFSFRTAATIIDETQARVLKDYNDSLRSNRHRKTFNKLMKQTIKNNEGNSVRGKSEVIAALRNIQNKDETFAALTRNMKKLNQRGVEVFAQDGKIQFNGISIDMAEFCSKRGNEVNTFLINLPSTSDVSPTEVSSVQNLFNLFHIDIPNAFELAKFAAKFLNCYNTDIKEKIIHALATLLSNIGAPVIQALTDILPINSVHYEIFQTVLKFFLKMAEQLEDQYQRWKDTRSEKDYNPLFDHVDPVVAKRCIQFTQKSVQMCFELKYMTRHALEKLIRFFLGWVNFKYSEYEEEKTRAKNRVIHSAKKGFRSLKRSCKVCKGYYFQSRS